MANLAIIYLPPHPPGLGQEMVPSGYPSPKYNLMRREPFPINPRYLITSPRQFYLRLIPDLPVFLPLIGDIIAGIGVGVLVPMKGRLCGWIELTDPGDAPGDLSGGVDLVPGLASRFVDEGRSEGRVSREPECTTVHCGLVEGTNKDRVMVIYMYVTGD